MLRRCLLAGALLLAVPSVALAHDPRSDRPSRWIGTAANLPLVTSPNVRLVDTFPDTQGISGEFARTGDFFYVSSLDSISVFDTSDPLHPRLTGTLANLVFENEAMSYGERKRADGTLQRFVLVGNDLYNATADDTSGVQRGRIGGGEMIVVDVTDPADPQIALARRRATTSTHTLQCVTASCQSPTRAGDTGKFSIIDLRDLDHPVEAGTAPSTAARPNTDLHHRRRPLLGLRRRGRRLAHRLGRRGGVRHLRPAQPGRPQRDRRQRHADAVERLHPPQLAAPERHALPRRRASRASAAATSCSSPRRTTSTTATRCCATAPARSRPGTCRRWDGNATIAPLDIINPVKFGDGLSTPAGGFCSAHWFDYHQSGIVAQGYYQQGLRLIDVRNARDLKQFGYVTGGATEVWDAYWVPQRDRRGVAQRTKTNIVYTTDLVRGLDVYQVDVPGTDLGETDDSLLDLLP